MKLLLDMIGRVVETADIFEMSCKNESAAAEMSYNAMKGKGFLMKREQLAYDQPKTRIYRFDDNDRILTESGIVESAEYAANALNEYLGGTNTTIE